MQLPLLDTSFATMTLHWTFVLYTLYVEVAFATLLMIPGLSSLTARFVRFLQTAVFSRMQGVKWAWWFLWMFYVCLFLEALRQVRLQIVCLRALSH